MPKMAQTRGHEFAKPKSRIGRKSRNAKSAVRIVRRYSCSLLIGRIQEPQALGEAVDHERQHRRSQQRQDQQPHRARHRGWRSTSAK